MNDRPKPPVWLIYGALALSQLGLVGAFVGVLERQTDPEPALSFVVPVFSLIFAAASVTVGRVWLTTLAPPAPLLLRWAFAEAVTMLGGLSWHLGGPGLIAAPMMAFGCLLVFAQPPVGE